MARLVVLLYMLTLGRYMTRVIENAIRTMEIQIGVHKKPACMSLAEARDPITPAEYAATAMREKAVTLGGK